MNLRAPNEQTGRQVDRQSEREREKTWPGKLRSVFSIYSGFGKKRKELAPEQKTRFSHLNNLFSFKFFKGNDHSGNKVIDWPFNLKFSLKIDFKQNGNEVILGEKFPRHK